MKNRIVEWSKRKYTEKQRIMLLIPLGILFVIIIPILLVLASEIDKALGFPKLLLAPINYIAGAALILLGAFFALWSIQAEFSIGKGTPAPMMPTQKLVTKGPFLYCRNPMTFGTICAYTGIAVLLGSLSTFIIIVALSSALLLYIKFIEEKELAERFGQDYLEYKKQVPFIIPRK